MTSSRLVARLLMLAGLLASVAAARPADACRCLEPKSAASAYRLAHVAVAGKVVAMTPRPDLDGVEVTFEVKEAWKAETPNTIRIATGTDCAFPFAKGGSYLLFLFREPADGYSTERCMGNRELEKAQPFLAWLRKKGHAGKVAAPGKTCGP